VAYFELIRLSIVVDIGIDDFNLEFSQLSTGIGPGRDESQSVLISQIQDHRLANRRILALELRLKGQSTAGFCE
jgi:hypothetical protein